MLVPQLVVAAAHLFHGRADVDEMLEELGGHTLVNRVLVGQLQGNAHQVETEKSHPTGRVGLFENGAVGKFLAAINHGNVVQS